MTFTAEKIALREIEGRHQKCRQLLQKFIPEASGLLLFSRTNIYYLTGSRANGILWLPLQGSPVLMVRKAEERCQLESPLQNIVSFKSYSQVPALCQEAQSPLGSCIAAEMQALPWSLANMLQERLSKYTFIAGDSIVHKARYTKSEYELACMRHAGNCHHKAFHEILPQKIHAGMSERQIAHTLWKIFYELHHGGMIRMEHFGEETFLGRIAAGNSGNYPTPFNGPLGVQGEHPALPFMGYAGNIWKKNEILTVDTGFNHKGYHSDCTVTYFAGKKESIPTIVQKAHACCQEILASAAMALKPGADLQQIWLKAKETAHKAGFADNFMGLGVNQVPFLGHSIGLAMDEWPAIYDASFTVENGAVFALEPKIALENIGMVGTEEVFAIHEAGNECLTGNMTNIMCIEDL